MLCPCGSGLDLAECCGPILAGERPAATAEALMRSRYSAYATGAVDYLLTTHDPSTRDVDAAALRRAIRRTTWLGLRIDDRVAGGEADDTGEVAFTARFRDARTTGELRERSRFRRHDGRWLYVDGVTSVVHLPEATPPAPAIGRGEPCPCGSGRKYKRCCGA